QGEGEGDAEEQAVLHGEAAHPRRKPLAGDGMGSRVDPLDAPTLARARGLFSGGAHRSFLPHRSPWYPTQLPGDPWDRPARTTRGRTRALLRSVDRPARTVLDGSPGRRGLVDHRGGHRDVVELEGHLVAILEGPAEELQGFGGTRRLIGFRVHEDKARRDDRPSGRIRLVEIGRAHV